MDGMYCKIKPLLTMRKQHIAILLSTLLFTYMGIAQSTGDFTDSRDGQTYKTISFENAIMGTTVIWMAQNLNYKVQSSYAYDDNESNRKELGLLYTWEAAKKACPNGWHLATDSEWSMLVSEFGGIDKAGEALKSLNGWEEGGNGTNSSGFNALPAGVRRNNGYDVQGYFGFWWSSTPTGEEGKAWLWDISYGGPDMSIKSKVWHFDGDTLGGLSVRCVRD
ncbi:FISUMP domain-containing protein [Allomuricauda sp. R78024]|uniref:FISUMP domain-containing protein n=1 Tax=Allomuricauda sp. R78024 TaxID=3093867 RepID=UPI0037C8953B